MMIKKMIKKIFNTICVYFIKLKYSKYRGQVTIWDLEDHFYMEAYCSKECDCEMGDFWYYINPKTKNIIKIYPDLEDSPTVTTFDALFVCPMCSRFFILKGCYELSEEGIESCESCGEWCFYEYDEEDYCTNMCLTCVLEEKAKEEKEEEDFGNFLKSPEDILFK